MTLIQKKVKKSLRVDFSRIASWIKKNSRVLDLGCGNGTLLAHLRDTLNVKGVGVELDDIFFVECMQRGIDIIQQNLENGLSLFEEKQFDTVILSQTLQSMHHTKHILLEMARVAQYGIVSFPNFGYWTHAFSIFLGRMPVTKQIPYQWYESPNVHLCTLKDFEDLASTLNLRILERSVFNLSKEIKLFPRWRATLAVYRFSSSPDKS